MTDLATLHGQSFHFPLMEPEVITLGELARHEFTKLLLETLPDTLSLYSVAGIRLSHKKRGGEW